MINNQLTKEENVQAVFDLKTGYTLGLADVEILKRVASMALVAMDSEPVFILEVARADYKGQKLGNHFGFITLDAARELKEGNYQLYRHAQPAPVVMDDIKLRELFDSWFASDCSFDRSPEASEEDNIAWRESYWYVWQRCRAAMLSAAPHDTPALNSVQSVDSVAGKWIPVSERMPESNGVYFGWDGKRVLEVNCFFGGWSANQFIHGEITHWMPLPAAPQEVKGE